VLIPGDRLKKMNAPWGCVGGISAPEPGNSGGPGCDPVVLALKTKLAKTQGNIFP